MADKKPPEDALDDLRRRVAAARTDEAHASRPPTNAASLAMRFGGEFGAAILVGSLLGYGVDAFAHTSPWGLIVGLAAGFAAGVVNVVRVAQAYSRSHPVDPEAPSASDDQE